MRKIPRNRLFVQVTAKDLMTRLWLLAFPGINCEIYLNPELIGLLGDSELERFRRVFDRKGMLRRLHAPVYDDCAGYPTVIENAYAESSRVCKAVGIEHVVMHAEYEKEKFPRLEDWLEIVRPTWRRIADNAVKDGITVLIENHHEPDALPIARILEMAGSPGLGACFDIGHFNAYGKDDIVSHLGAYPPRSIGEVHLSDNLGDGDSHLALGRGNIDFAAFFETVDAMGIEPVYTIEAKDVMGVIGGMNYLRKIRMI